MSITSAFTKARSSYQPKLPPALTAGARLVQSPVDASSTQAEIRSLFPHTYDLPAVTFAPAGTPPAEAVPLRVGVILSGGPAPGGHNVIAGLFDGLQSIHPASSVFGFSNGPDGLLTNRGQELGAHLVDTYRNTGGFDIIGSGRTKLESTADFEKALETASARSLDALVVIGGDDSNSNASKLAEFARARGSKLLVAGVPKTIDGDLKGRPIETSFGFDTACKVYSDLIGNIQRDALSARKYWHFIKLMGRSASHIALECALQTHPNVTLISEEIAARKTTLREIVADIAETVRNRAGRGEKFGTVLIPEGLIEFIPEMGVLIGELNEVLAHDNDEFQQLGALEEKRSWVAARLTAASQSLYASLPADIASQLILDRDPHGNVQVARIDTQRLLIDLVEAKLAEWKKDGSYKASFAPLPHYFGYEGRCAAPSNFDADYTYSLGFTAALLLREGLTGYIATVQNLDRPSPDWVPGGYPLARLMNMERRHGQMVPVIKKALVELDGPAFQALEKNRRLWALETSYVFPGSVQYFGPSEVCDQPTATLLLENSARPA